MQIKLKKSVQGYSRSRVSEDTDIQTWEVSRCHANKGDILKVILKNPTHYICDSVYYPDTHIAVFQSQVEEIINPVQLETDDHDIEKYYHVYEEPHKSLLDDPFYRALFEDTENS